MSRLTKPRWENSNQSHRIFFKLGKALKIKLEKIPANSIETLNKNFIFDEKEKGEDHLKRTKNYFEKQLNILKRISDRKWEVIYSHCKTAYIK